VQLFILTLSTTVALATDSKGTRLNPPPFTITGSVKDETGELLIGANVTVEGTQKGVLTDLDGKYSLELTDAEKNSMLVISYVGYEKQRSPINGRSEINITLKSLQSLDAIVVSASRKAEKITEAPSAISILTSKNIVNDVVAHPTQSLRYITGISVIDNGNGYPVVSLRGAGSPFAQDAYILIDNRNIVTPGFRESAMNRTSLDALDLARVEVVKGAASALYGPGVETGVVNYITKDPFQYRGTSVSAYGGERKSLGVSFRHAGVSKNEKFGYKITGFYRTMEGFGLDSTNAEDAIMLKKLQGTVGPDGKKYIVNAFDNSLTDVAVPTYWNESVSLNFTGEYRFTDRTNIGVFFGRTQAKGLSSRTSSLDYTDVPNDYASIKFKSGNFWSQFSYIYANNNSGIGNFLTGRTRFLQGKQYDFQAQYTFTNLPEKWEVLVGGDARTLSLNSKNQEYGTNEGKTASGTIGAYGQVKYNFSKQWYVSGTLRYDYFEQALRSYVAPRIAAVYKATEDHVFRISYNKAVGAFDAATSYLQSVAGSNPDYNVRLWGNKNPLEWNTNNVRLFTRLGGTRSNNVNTLNFDEAINFGATGSALSADAIAYLKSLGLTGGSNIVLKVNNVGAPIKVDQIYKKPVYDNDPNKIEAATSQMYEIGYNGSFAKKLNVTVDLWLMRRKNFYSNPQAVTAVASAPTMVADFKAALAAKADPARLAALGLTVDQIAAAIGTQYATRFGVIDIASQGGDAKPNVLNTFVQGANLDYWGLDLGAQYAATSALTVFANYSYLSDNEFSSSLTGNENSGIVYYLVQPHHRFKLGGTYNAPNGFSANAGMIYNSGFDSFLGGATIQKVITAYTVVDAGVGYNFGNGLVLNLTATNLLNQYYRALPQYARTGRLALLKATYDFGGKPK
jgi:iron complex outermembrane receptor protein